jgi:hypothetical protein
VQRFGSEIATDRNVEIGKVYCAAGWLPVLAHLRGEDVGRTL